MKKNKILIIMPGLFIGGAERSLLGILDTIDYTRNEVFLFLYRHEGEFLKSIPTHVNVLPYMPQYATFDVPIKSLLTGKQFMFGIARLISKIAMSLHCHVTGEKKGIWMQMQYTSRFLQFLLPNVPGKYDLGIMFLGVADTLINKVDAKVKVTWCHTDYDSLMPSKKMDRQVYDRLDWIVNVSESCTQIFNNHYPQYRAKTVTIENILAKTVVVSESQEPVSDFGDTGEIKLLSIGRFNEIKNFHNIPLFCRALRYHNLNVHWYIIGYGMDEQRIRDSISKNEMEKYVTVLGKKENPYPYIANCDLYVQPSLLEGKCVTVREAQLLGKPVVITNYATSASQLEDGVDGVIVPMDNEGCARGIAELLRDPEKMKRLSETCLQRDYSNAEEVEKIYKLME